MKLGAREWVLVLAAAAVGAVAGQGLSVARAEGPAWVGISAVPGQDRQLDRLYLLARDGDLRHCFVKSGKLIDCSTIEP
jgi:hypothetical protein